MNSMKMCVMVLYCNVYAGQGVDLDVAEAVVQEINPIAISLYQRCIGELAEPGIDNRHLPDAIQRDIYSLQVERFAEYSEVYEELRERALQSETFGCRAHPFSTITQEAIAYAYKHFADSDVSCATEVARGYASLPEAVFCVAQLIHLSVVLSSGISAADCSPLFFPNLGLCVGSSCGLYLCMSGRMSLKKQCLDAALPHYNPPKTMRMHLEIPDSSFVCRESFPVDDDISGEDEIVDDEDVLYNDGMPLLHE